MSVLGDAYDWLVAGAGLTGATLAERIASQLNERVLVVERRDHIAGNAHDYVDEHGILTHRYGPHIFHTSSKVVWDYLSQFTEWRPYEHRVLADIDGALVPLPVNLTSIDRFTDEDPAEMVRLLLERFPGSPHVPVLKLRESDDARLRRLGDAIFNRVFVDYTVKQWAMRPEDLDASVTGRVPIRLNDDDRYFTDEYQAIPQRGYTALVANMLAHPNISVALSCDFREVGTRATNIVYTGAIDEYFEFCLGALPYRSIDFESTHWPGGLRQPVATINYPSAPGFTRVTEVRQITGQETEGTTLIREFPTAHVWGKNEPLYPIPRSDSRALYQRYAELPRPENVYFAGRLGDYRYYNMDQAVGSALHLFETIAAGRR